VKDQNLLPKTHAGNPMPLTLPPLNALRACEAVAQELGVSAAAILQTIRKL